MKKTGLWEKSVITNLQGNQKKILTCNKKFSDNLVYFLRIIFEKCMNCGKCLPVKKIQDFENIFSYKNSRKLEEKIVGKKLSETRKNISSKNVKIFYFRKILKYQILSKTADEKSR